MNDFNNNVLNVIFTVDVEDKRGHDAVLIEGDLSQYGISENCGVNFIMDTFAAHNASAVFFVNIYEKDRYDIDYMPALLRRIRDKGMEIGLHTHMDEEITDSELKRIYTKQVSQMTQAEMEALFSYGRDYIFNATGEYPISYRSGAYQSNDSLFAALKQTGFLVDSSVYGEGYKNNHMQKYAAMKNQVFLAEGIMEFPVVTVFSGLLWKRLDIDTLSETQLKNAFEEIRTCGMYDAVQIMFHSFSFLDQEKKDRPVLVDKGNRKVYGEKTEGKAKLKAILDWMAASECYNITNFREYLNGPHKVPPYQEDNHIYLANRHLAFTNQNVEVSALGNRLHMENTFPNDSRLNFAWEIINSESKKYAQSGYSKNQSYEMLFGADVTDTFIIKALIKDDEGNRAYGIYWKVATKNGQVISLQKVVR